MNDSDDEKLDGVGPVDNRPIVRTESPGRVSACVIVSKKSTPC